MYPNLMVAGPSTSCCSFSRRATVYQTVSNERKSLWVIAYRDAGAGWVQFRAGFYADDSGRMAELNTGPCYSQHQISAATKQLLVPHALRLRCWVALQTRR